MWIVDCGYSKTTGTEGVGSPQKKATTQGNTRKQTVPFLLENLINTLSNTMVLQFQIHEILGSDVFRGSYNNFTFNAEIENLTTCAMPFYRICPLVRVKALNDSSCR